MWFIYLRESERGERGLAGIAESVGSHCKVSKERVDVRSIFDQRVLLFIAKKSLELFEGHVLHVLTVGIELLTNLREEGKRERERERERERMMCTWVEILCLLLNKALTFWYVL